MRNLGVVIATLVLAACEPAEDINVCLCDAGTRVDGGPACDPVSQTGCATGEKCTWIRIDSPNGIGTLGCVDDGSREVGEACAYGPEGETTGHDNCVGGAICNDGVCETTCFVTPESCATLETCVVHPGTFPEESGIGGCSPPP